MILVSEGVVCFSLMLLRALQSERIGVSEERKDCFCCFLDCVLDGMFDSDLL